MSLFKNFTPDDVGGQNQVKSSVQRGIRNSILETYPRLEPVMDELWGKNDKMVVAKCKDHVTIVVINNVPIFFQHRDGPWFPTLKTLHKYPTMMPKWRVDKGAIRFVLRGANIMCPGLTHPAGRMEDVPENTCVQIVAEGKEHACAVGMSTMSAQKIRDVNKGNCVDVLHYLGDGLYKCSEL